jgi:hypothetical protein
VIAKKTRFAIIESLRWKHRLSWLFQITEVSRAGYYKWKTTCERVKRRAQLEQDVKEQILAIHAFAPSPSS